MILLLINISMEQHKTISLQDLESEFRSAEDI